MFRLCLSNVVEGEVCSSGCSLAFIIAFYTYPSIALWGDHKRLKRVLIVFRGSRIPNQHYDMRFVLHKFKDNFFGEEEKCGEF